ncbi:DNA-processing protein DprA [Marinobacter caseinilyticus]|uniref:DNA-processing protein DprA n=1 Tax=Marinobacter caseinilyticus TaxID=2692195 RepID=UPI00140DF211|nr:DNA-processing protein DprA [Marinobacter caseinilyticus]
MPRPESIDSVPAVASLFDDPQAPWLVLSRLPRMGVRRWQAVRDHLDSPQELLSIGYATLKALNLDPATCDMIAAWQARDACHAGLARVASIWQQCRRDAIELVTWGCATYPDALRVIHDAPLALYVKGDSGLLNRPQLGMVGSRNATRGGLDHARHFAAALSQQGYLVTSGLALGIDGAAHAGALDAGYPTVAVIGTGVDVIYPRQHGALTARIADHGAIVSDLPPGTPPKAAYFPQRNRIISGLSRGVLVVEASPKSGSLITARLALEQGREVFAIPGSIHNPLARGCHQLIRQGAKLVESVQDIEEELTAWWSHDRTENAPNSPVKQTLKDPPKHGFSARVFPRSPASGGIGPGSGEAAAVTVPGPASTDPDQRLSTHLDDREIAVLKALGYDPVSTDALCVLTGLPADQLMQSLLLLEVEGLVDSAPGGFLRAV